MAEIVQLRGMTWSDPRGYDPVMAAARAFAAQVPDVRILWDKRSLQEFETTPVNELAAQYDLMVIDHPHVGAVVAENCVLALEAHASEGALARLANESVGKSFESYFYAGHQWALPIDAAAQVQAIRPDLRPVPFRRFSEVLEAAQPGQIVWPLRPPHGLMSFFTLAANIGTPCGVRPGTLIGDADGQRVLAALQALADAVDPACHAMDPIAALDALSEGTRFHAAPLCYLYATYARTHYRPHRLTFHDIPALGFSGPLGSALGGTGIAVSARTREPGICTRFALWLANAEVQSGLYAAHNGQPGNARAWGSAAVNAAVDNAFANTRMTHEAAWLRPRHPGYMAFQDEGSAILGETLQGRRSHKTALSALNTCFNASFQNGR